MQKGKRRYFHQSARLWKGKGRNSNTSFLLSAFAKACFSFSWRALWCLQRWAPISRRATDKGSLSSLVDAMAVVEEEVYAMVVVEEEVHAMVVVEEDPATPVGVEAL